MGFYEDDLITIGKRLTQLRIKSGYKSYESFAVEHDFSRVQYWRIEKGKTNLTIKSLKRVLLIHNITLREFFCEDTETVLNEIP